MTEKNKSFLVGLVSSILLAIIGLVITYFVKFSDYEIADFVQMLTRNNMLAPLIAVCLVPNLLPFHFFLRRSNYDAVRGILAGMVLWAIVIVWFKFSG